MSRSRRDCESLPGDTVIQVRAPVARGSEGLQRSGEHAVTKMSELGHEPLFGVSGWIVAPPDEPFPPGFARVSTLESEGFQVVPTPHLGRKEHVTILLEDPVDDEQAARFSAAFGCVVKEGEEVQ